MASGPGASSAAYACASTHQRSVDKAQQWHSVYTKTCNPYLREPQTVHISSRCLKGAATQRQMTAHTHTHTHTHTKHFTHLDEQCPNLMFRERLMDVLFPILQHLLQVSQLRPLQNYHKLIVLIEQKPCSCHASVFQRKGGGSGVRDSKAVQQGLHHEKVCCRTAC